MMRVFAAASLAAGILLSTAGTSAAGRPAPGSASPATPAGNRAATRQEVRRLMRLAPLPAGTHRTCHAPRVLRGGPGGGDPEARSLIDRHRFYRVPVPFRRATRWLARHEPRALEPIGSGQVSSHGRVIERDLTFADRDSAAWTQAELDIAVARGAQGTSVWRVDGFALWLDPRPLRDWFHGRRMRVTYRSGCPASDHRVGDVHNAGARLHRMLLPPGRVRRVLLCAYHGLNGHPFALRVHRRYGPTVAGGLTRRLRAMPLTHVDGAVYSCPMDDGSAYVVDFGLAGHRDVDIWVHATGCAGDDNGDIVVGDALGGAVRRLLR